MTAAGPQRAQRWFWALTATAVCAAGTLYQALRATAGPGTGLCVLVSSLVLAASVIQASRILTVLAGQTRSARSPRTCAGRARRRR